jgi:hypothetical protein
LAWSLLYDAKIIKEDVKWINFVGEAFLNNSEVMVNYLENFPRADSKISQGDINKWTKSISELKEKDRIFLQNMLEILLLKANEKKAINPKSKFTTKELLDELPIQLDSKLLTHFINEVKPEPADFTILYEILEELNFESFVPSILAIFKKKLTSEQKSQLERFITSEIKIPLKELASSMKRFCIRFLIVERKEDAALAHWMPYRTDIWGPIDPDDAAGEVMNFPDNILLANSFACLEVMQTKLNEMKK